MFPAEFDYHRASTVDEALALLGGNPEAKLLAGGHSLIPMMKLRLAQPAAVVDIARIADLRGIRAGEGTVIIGAATPHAEVAASALVREACPLAAEAAAQIADPAVRNRGTVGGNIAHADPASDWPAVLVVVGAKIHLKSAGASRTVAAGDFFLDLMATALGEGEIITAVELPRLPAGTGSCYLKLEHPASGYALCGAAAWIQLENGKVGHAGLAFNGIANTPVGVDLSALFGGAADDDAIARVVAERLSVADPLSDLYASGPYRVELAKVYGKRALSRARERAQG
jgi:carbon-monoxide dehydrogenase medium subunit